MTALRLYHCRRNVKDRDFECDRGILSLQELLRARRRLQQRSLPSGDSTEDQGEQNLTLVMVIIIVIFVVCQSPAFGNQLLYYLIGDEQYACGQVSCCLYTQKFRNLNTKLM